MSSIRKRAWWATLGFVSGLMVVTLAAQTVRYNCTLCLMGTLRVVNGTAMAPSFSFQNDTGTGFYRASSGNIGESGNILPSADAAYDLGSGSFRFRNVYVSGSIAGAGVQFGDGSSGTPSIAFASTSTLGFYKFNASNIGFTGGLMAGTDASFDLGAVAARRPNNGFFAGLVVGSSLQVGAGAATTSNILLRSSDAAGLLSVKLGNGSDWGDVQGRNFTGVSLQLVPAATSQPTCNSGNRGKFWYIPGSAGVADQMQMCGKARNDLYYWVTIL
jgi:hypothetical protein